MTSPRAPAVLNYAGAGTRLPFVVTALPLGGAVITILPSAQRGHLFSLNPHGRIGRVLQSVFGRWRPHALISISRNEVQIHRWVSQGRTSRWQASRWPRQEVLILRANRYGGGFYVRIAGADDFDFLTELKPKLIPILDALVRDVWASLDNSA